VRTRSIYLPIIRNELPTILEVFDFADPDVPVGQRDSTTVSTQALFLMNSAFANRHARLTAERLLVQSPDDAQRLKWLFLRAFSRQPTLPEIRLTQQFLKDFSARLATLPTEHRPQNVELEAWSAVCLAVFCSHEFRYIE
jgi:hypothetical protein